MASQQNKNIQSLAVTDKRGCFLRDCMHTHRDNSSVNMSEAAASENDEDDGFNEEEEAVTGFCTFAGLYKLTRAHDSICFQTHGAGSPLKMGIIARGYKEVDGNEKLDRAMASNKPPMTEEEKMDAIICIHWKYDGEQYSIESKWNESISNDRYSQPQEVIRTCTPVLEPLKDVMARYGSAKIIDSEDEEARAKKMGITAYGKTKVDDNMRLLIEEALAVPKKQLVYDEIMATDEYRVTAIKYEKCFSEQVMSVHGFGHFLSHLLLCGRTRAVATFGGFAGAAAAWAQRMPWLHHWLQEHAGKLWDLLQEIKASVVALVAGSSWMTIAAVLTGAALIFAAILYFYWRSLRDLALAPKKKQVVSAAELRRAYEQLSVGNVIGNMATMAHDLAVSCYISIAEWLKWFTSHFV